MIQACLMLVYTEYEPDPHIKHKVGWASAIFFTLQVLISFSIVVGGTLKTIKLTCKRCCSRCERRQQLKEAKKLAEAKATKEDGKENEVETVLKKGQPASD